MLPRSEMVKVEKHAKNFASEAKLTRVQELKQADFSLDEKGLQAVQCSYIFQNIPNPTCSP